MKKTIKSVIVGLLAGVGMLAFMWVVLFGMALLMTFIGNLTGSIFIGAMTPLILLAGTIACLVYYVTHD